MIEYLPSNGMLAGAQLYKLYAAWKPQLAAKISVCTFLILKDRQEIDFESNLCLAEKLTCQWK